MALHGKDGAAKIGSTEILDITSWSLDISKDAHDVTAFDTSSLPWREFLAGLIGVTGSLEGHLDMSDTTGQVALWTSLTSDSPLTLNLFINATQKFTASAFITSFGPEVSVGDPETVGFDFQVTGAVTFA